MRNPCEFRSPRLDGIDHVNVYSRARTPEGKLLSNFAATPFVLHGRPFASVEGFYQAMRFDDEAKRREFAAMAGAVPKKCGDESGTGIGSPVCLWDGRVVPYEGPECHDELLAGVRAKVLQNPDVQEALVRTEQLPLTHYYVMMGKPLHPRGETGRFAASLEALRREVRTPALVRAVLGELADAGAAELVRRLTDKRTHLAAACALAFRDGPLEPEAVAVLAELVHDPDAAVCHRALRTLVQRELPAERGVALFRDVLRHPAPTVRAAAAAYLGRLGAAAEEAVAELRMLQNDCERWVSTFATAALQRISSSVEPVLIHQG